MKIILLRLLTVSCLIAALDVRSADLYRLDFQSSRLQSTPGDFFVLKGDFLVKEEDGRRFLESPAQPLDVFAALFGPNIQMNAETSIKAFGRFKGRLKPSFGIGFNGVGGVRLMVEGGRRQLEIISEGKRMQASPFEMPPNVWIHLKFRCVQLQEGCQYLGKAWKQGDPEPEAWMVEHAANETPFPGKCSLIGVPYSGEPIRFDDLKITELKAR